LQKWKLGKEKTIINHITRVRIGNYASQACKIVQTNNLTILYSNCNNVWPKRSIRR